MTINDWCRRRYWKFLAVGCLGPLFMKLYEYKPTMFNPMKDIFFILKWIDYIFLPRPILEIELIKETLGIFYYQFSVVFECLTSILCIFLVILHVKQVRQSKIVLEKMDQKSFWTAILASTLVIFRPTLAHYASITSNVIDESGFYFFREGFLICIGYYFAMKIMLNKINI